MSSRGLEDDCMPEVHFPILHDTRASLLCEHSFKIGHIRYDVDLLAPELALE
jgi:hypothetical protein